MNKIKRRVWTIGEIEFLKRNYCKIGYRECAKKLNRSISSVKGCWNGKGFRKKGMVPTNHICSNCNISFYHPVKNRKFCSSNCYYESHYTTHTCIICNKEFRLRICDKNKGRKICDRACVEKWYVLEGKRKCESGILGNITPEQRERGLKKSRETHRKLAESGASSRKMKEIWKRESYRKIKTQQPHDWWKSLSDKEKEEFVKKTRVNARPNKGELALINLFNDNNLPYKFVGDNSLIISGFNPDFVNCNGSKKIIELFGTYWHKRPNVIERDKRRLVAYSNLGYETLIIWENELKDLDSIANKVKEFEHGNI